MHFCTYGPVLNNFKEYEQFYSTNQSQFAALSLSDSAFSKIVGNYICKAQSSALNTLSGKVIKMEDRHPLMLPFSL